MKLKIYLNTNRFFAIDYEQNHFNNNLSNHHIKINQNLHNQMQYFYNSIQILDLL